MSATTIFFKQGAGQADFTQEVCVEEFTPERPFPQNPSAMIFRARFKQLRAYYTRPVVNTPHPNLPQVYFADDGQQKDIQGGMVEWIRTWCTIPASWDDYESTSYPFPGYANIRVPFSKTVTGKLTMDYFLVGTLPTFSNVFTNYDDFNNASWTKSGATSAANQAAIPACAGGTVTAAAITEGNTTSKHYATQAGSVLAGVIFGACFVKAGTRKAAAFGLEDGSGNVLASCQLNLTTGQLSNVVAPTGWAQAYAVGDGWFRVVLIGTTGTTSGKLNCYLLQTADGPLSYTGDGASYLYFWRGQVAISSVPVHATVPPTTSPDGATYPYSAAGNIAVKFGQTYTYSWAGNAAVEYLSGSSTPTLTTYQGWVTTDAGSSTSYSIEANDSELALWVGSCWVRRRRFVKAR